MDRLADADDVSLAALITRIDDERAGSGAPLSSAVRVWLFERAL